jgi:acetyl-CoA carboxylase carboxyl transferase subunit alpha
MMENAWYSVISPENCSTILWRSWAKKEVAAEQLRLTAIDNKAFGLIDDIVPEPIGGAHWDYNEAACRLKQHLKNALAEMKAVPPLERIDQRIEKFGKMGFWDETAQTAI